MGRWGRGRGWRVAVLGVVVAALVAAAAVAHVQQSRHRVLPLATAGVALGAGGQVVEVTAADRLVPGTRVLAGTADSARLAADQRRWLAAGTVPAVPELGGSTMVVDALLDLHVLSQPYGVPVAGWTGPWRYVWPRDSGFAAAALARTGHLADADRILDFLARVQPADGVFQARYLPDGSGVPDDRGVQLDGAGWTLWALGQVAACVPAADRTAFLDRHAGLLDRSTAAALTMTGTRDALPPPSADYWELPKKQTTLATAAVVRAGLGAARVLYASRDPARAAAAARAYGRLGDAIRTRFGPDYPREPGGRAGSVDLGVDFLLPPFADQAAPDQVRAWRASAGAMGRASGGLAPGGSWRRDGISWTNATATYALAAAGVGARDQAVSRLRWLDAHRTAQGALPEKVLPDGQPAAVAPLAWSAAAVVLTADELQSTR